ncbi:hypothetical protein Nepgr_005301 [Nepenthes gracilis]|uniref:Uncharacterized protein n=1 Tax=Nepenthes gracilis TaxID=150966 RepID=A0AAD3XGA7_NEPGR|nr:hypothetical protein Nepgr_005301 [Nepenthes gracilis]
MLLIPWCSLFITRTVHQNYRQQLQPALQHPSKSGRLKGSIPACEQHANHPIPRSQRPSQIIQLVGSNEQQNCSNQQQHNSATSGGISNPAKIGTVAHQTAHHHTSPQDKSAHQTTQHSTEQLISNSSHLWLTAADVAGSNQEPGNSSPQLSLQRIRKMAKQPARNQPQ